MEFERDCSTVCERDRYLQLAMSGDQEALGRVLVSYMPGLYRVALRVLGTPQDAEDALQDGLLQAVRHLGDFEGASRFSTWLTRIVINAALMRLRQNRARALTSIEQKLDADPESLSLADRMADPAPNPEETYARSERLRFFDQILRGLPAAYRSALWLRDIQGMNTREAAEILGLNTSTLKSRLRRGRVALRKKAYALRNGLEIHEGARSEAWQAA